MSPSSDASRTLRALPTILRVGFSEAVAYRAEFVVWLLAYTMPLIMLAMWSAVAREAPVGRFGEAEFSAYFLVTLLVRMLTASWVVWELNMAIRYGALGALLVKPMHPVIMYASSNIAALPLRLVMATPIALLGLWWIGVDAVTHDPATLGIAILALIGTLAMNFLIMTVIGSLTFFWESSLSAFDLWIGLYAVLSGYVMPLELLPAWIRPVVDFTPFPYMLSFPVQTLLGDLSPSAALSMLAIQWTWLAFFLVTAVLLFRAGVRRFEAFGG